MWLSDEQVTTGGAQLVKMMNDPKLNGSTAAKKSDVSAVVKIFSSNCIQ